MTPSLPAILSLVTDAAREGATPEERRAAVEQLLRELSPVVEAALADRPVVLAGWALTLDALDTWEDGLTADEAAELVKGVGEVVALAVRTPFARRPRGAHLGLKALLSRARADAAAARGRADELRVPPSIEIQDPS